MPKNHPFGNFILKSSIHTDITRELLGLKSLRVNDK